jgi:hypothetical protein
MVHIGSQDAWHHRRTFGNSYPFPGSKPIEQGPAPPISKKSLEETAMDPNERISSGTGLSSLRVWLGSPVTLTLPGWGVAAGAAAVLLLVLLALD